MGSRMYAIGWAVLGAALVIGAVALNEVNLIFALMSLSLSAACFALAGACLLRPKAAPDQTEAAERERLPRHRRNWRP